MENLTFATLLIAEEEYDQSEEVKKQAQSKAEKEDSEVEEEQGLSEAVKQGDSEVNNKSEAEEEGQENASLQTPYSREPPSPVTRRAGELSPTPLIITIGLLLGLGILNLYSPVNFIPLCIM